MKLVRGALRAVGLTVVVIVVLVAWVGIVYAIDTAMRSLDGRTSCDRPVDCEVSPQDAWQPH